MEKIFRGAKEQKYHRHEQLIQWFKLQFRFVGCTRCVVKLGKGLKDF